MSYKVWPVRRMPSPSSPTDAPWDLLKDHFDPGNDGKSRKERPRDFVKAVLFGGCTAFNGAPKQKGESWWKRAE